MPLAEDVILILEHLVKYKSQSLNLARSSMAPAVPTMDAFQKPCLHSSLAYLHRLAATGSGVRAAAVAEFKQLMAEHRRPVSPLFSPLASQEVL